MKNNEDYIGCDETGVGDFFSPIVFVAAYIYPENYLKILNLGVKDSKKITDKKILEIAPQIMKLTKFTGTILTQQGNNQLANNFNTNEVKLIYHYLNINKLQKEIDKQAFIDQFSTLNSIKKYEDKLSKILNTFIIPKYPVNFETKAEDKILSVACASILARYYLLIEMQKQDQKYHMHFPLGASSSVIEFGKKFLKIYGQEKLKEVSKTNFKTFSQITTNK
ncbi:ribonuclease HIII [Mycoplasma miroungirhinis]|uniref:Ribonuclease n=1 Tax=Mycoplasma miroungirhinis TaxID=754516 RepID=A0A6M4JD54_9MOLU|nr:ribonuclease HIII [Mycoplasma miroungirhinis]QJR43999.1 ribonuclease HIII [Mycoplasma miroungirhinis]